MQRPSVEYHDSASILRDPLPSLPTRDGYQTTSTAWRSLYHVAQLSPWRMDEEVRRWASPGRLKPGDLSVRSHHLLQQVGCLDHEHYLCGDEQSVCGRFAQNTLGPVTAVAFHNEMKYRFGDYKVCEESKRSASKKFIPDFVGVCCSATNIEQLKALPKDEKPTMVLLGEAKTPWKHNLQAIWDRYRADPEDDEGIRLAFAGHVGGKAPRLNFSRPIPATNSPRDGENCVSVRQCFYYLLSIIEENNDYRFDNPCPREEWGNSKAHIPGYEPLTPNTSARDPGNSMIQATPSGLRPTSPSSPLYLQKTSGDYKAELTFRDHQIRDRGLGRKVVILNGQGIGIIVDGDDEEKEEEGDDGNDSDDSDSDDDNAEPLNPLQRRPMSGYFTLPKGDRTPEKRSVAFNLPIRTERLETIPTLEVESPTPAARLAREGAASRGPNDRRGTSALNPLSQRMSTARPSQPAAQAGRNLPLRPRDAEDEQTAETRDAGGRRQFPANENTPRRGKP
ncbi:hypothetical protein UA08_08677 [Talaromyces atroroseus]|uniref:Uncharacterized protein n=1 Tax=Talaromyces atroroseus TaxID=1441469 RepID=A0A225A690_TALAT|nr:hypothetical protein UA08_08677 [Talaromyces atroroseus]OKL56011.1 hypothetical protein UA08_08677 [Talaromyces atroroseus]